MPARKVADKQKEIANDLRAVYGGMMCFKDIKTELGFKHDDPTAKFLKDVPYVEVNNRKRWRVVDIAKRIYESMVV